VGVDGDGLRGERERERDIGKWGLRRETIREERRECKFPNKIHHTIF
jgi:hypothetical protein